MVVMRGEGARRLARTFLAEYMRVHVHFDYREAVNARHAATPPPSPHAHHAAASPPSDEGRAAGHDAGQADDWWLTSYFNEGHKLQRERTLFVEGMDLTEVV